MARAKSVSRAKQKPQTTSPGTVQGAVPLTGHDLIQSTKDQGTSPARAILFVATTNRLCLLCASEMIYPEAAFTERPLVQHMNNPLSHTPGSVLGGLPHKTCSTLYISRKGQVMEVTDSPLGKPSEVGTGMDGSEIL